MMATNSIARTARRNAKVGPSSVNAPQVTEVYDKMRGFIKSTHWSKPYYSALVHNNPQLPYHLLEHVNCTYLSTPGRAPTLLSLKQHAQSLAILISLLAPAQYGGTFEPPNEEKINGDAPFAAEQAFDWLNNLQEHYHTDDGAHKKPLNALVNLVKSNSDTKGPKWHCPLDTTGIEFPEKHSSQKYRPYESHMTLLMHANEILERLDHEYSAMGGILGIIPLDCENVEEQRALSQAKTTLVGQWILYTQHLVARMHELEIAYGNSLDLLANEAVVPMQHVGQHGPDGHSGREPVFPQDRWIMANAGEDVFTFIHRLLDQAEAHQDTQDDQFAEQKVLGDAAYSGHEDRKYRGITKADLSTRFYRLRGSGHGPLFVLPAFGDRPNTKHTRDMENRPTVVAIPQPNMKEPVSSWEARHKDVDEHMLKFKIDKANLEAEVSRLQSSVALRDREIERLNEIQKQYDEQLSQGDKDLAKEVVHLNESIGHFQRLLKESGERENVLKEEVQNFKDANTSVQNDQNPINSLVTRINDQQSKIHCLEKEIKERDKKVEDLARDNGTLRIRDNSPMDKNSLVASPPQETQLRAQLARVKLEKQLLQQQVDSFKKSSSPKGKTLHLAESLESNNESSFEDTSLGVKPAKIINLPWGLKYTSTFRDDNQGLIVLNTEWYDQLVAIEKLAEIRAREIMNLEAKIARLQVPIEGNLNGASINSLNEKLGQSQVYKDTESNVAILKLDYYDELLTKDQSKTTIETELKESKKEVQTLRHRLVDARQKLDDSRKDQASLEIELPDLQIQRDDFEIKLAEALSKCESLEKQVHEINTYRPPSVLETRVLKVQKQLTESKAAMEKKNTELQQLQQRHNALLHNETNLRTEVRNLRVQLDVVKMELEEASASLKTRPPSGAQNKQESEGLEAAQEEIESYKMELDMLHQLWSDLQTQHATLQAEFEDAQERGDEEKQFLQRKVDEYTLVIQGLQDQQSRQDVTIKLEDEDEDEDEKEEEEEHNDDHDHE
ncbi:hypothetical protein F5Y09DRAFT_259974 [Xylaria sp. FL1042]|nr:hypothetical protein F5Y09DRAFT_259974 [Xylaria sp. FL1042]